MLSKDLLCRPGDLNLMPRSHVKNKSECDGTSHSSQCYTARDRKTPRPQWPVSLTNSVNSKPMKDTQILRWGRDCSPVVKNLCSICETLGSIRGS